MTNNDVIQSKEMDIYVYVHSMNESNEHRFIDQTLSSI